jgi:hypothetical protein
LRQTKEFAGQECSDAIALERMAELVAELKVIH